MNIRRTWLAASILALASGGAAAHAAQPNAAEDREAIRLVLRDYGRLLDERRFDEFGQLFAQRGEYVSAGTTTRGPTAIADSLRPPPRTQ